MTSKLLTCPTCLDLNLDAQKLKPCGHRICLKCINKAKKHQESCTKKSPLKCPFCNVIVVKHSIDPIIKEFVDEELAKEKNRCEIHPTKTYFSICTDCQEPVCSECILSNHNGHNLVSGDDITYSNQLKSKMVEATKEAPSKKLIIDNELKEIQTKSEAFENIQSKINNYIRDSTGLIFKFLQLNEFTNKKVSDGDLENQVTHNSRFNESFTSSSKTLETISSFTSDSPFNVYAAIKLLKELNSTDELLSTYKSEKIDYRNKTVPNQDTQKSIEKLIPKLFIHFKCRCGVGDSTIPCPCLPYPTTTKATSTPTHDIITTIPIFASSPANGIKVTDTLSGVDPKKVAGTLNAVQLLKIKQKQQDQLELKLKEQQQQFHDFQFQHQQKQQQAIVQPEQSNPVNTIKKINFIYFLCGMEDKLHLSRCVRYHPAKDEWSFMPPTRYKRACVTDAGVVAFGYLFIFGGNDSLETYEKFNIHANRWEIGGNIPTGGGSSMSATYDKQRECIYLVGGVKFNQTSSKIEKCTYVSSGNGRDNTLKFEILANLKYSRYYCYTIVHGNQLYIIGGTNKTKEESYFSIINNIEVYNIDTKQVSMFYEGLDESENRIEGVCFDGVDKFYIITIDTFFSFTLSTKQRTKLFYPPIENMRFGFSISIGKSNLESEKNQNIIYLIGDRGSSHFRYNITTGLWATSQSKRPISSYFHAAAVEYEVNSS